MEGAVEASEPKSVRSRAMRAQSRFPFEIRVGDASGHDFFVGSTRDVSEGGIFVATHLTYDVGTLVEVSLLLPGDAGPTTLVTEVRWVRSPHAADGERPGLGLRFVEIPAAALARIRELTQERAPLFHDS